MRLQRFINEQKQKIFASYQDSLDWIVKRAKKLGMTKNEFLTTDEYKKLYPIIDILYRAEKAKTVKAAEKIMKEVGVSFGDRVEYRYVGSFMSVEDYTGEIVSRKGIPFVKLDKGQTTINGKKYTRWHKGWKKIK